jgi:broad specificity phosphatase PhoE
MTLVIRHSLSEANNRNNYGTPAFGHPDAPLMPAGREIAQEMGTKLQEDYKLDPESTPVAVSEMLRAQETAREAGFVIATRYLILNEVDTLLPYGDLREMIQNKHHTDIAIEAAEHILENPPEQQVWVTHGLVIAALCKVLGVENDFENFVPKFCEIRELSI